MCFGFIQGFELLGKLDHAHYDLFRHEESGGFHASPVYVIVAGVPVDMLQHEWWVPGVNIRAEHIRFASKPQWREILTVSGRTCLLWLSRMTQDPVQLISKRKPCSLNTMFNNQHWQDFERRVDATSTCKQKAWRTVFDFSN